MNAPLSAEAKTGIYVGAALVLVALAFLTAPGSGRTDRFNDEGELFFPDFLEPTQAVALEVIEVDEKNVEGKLFKVEFANGVWTIPSHHDYPADAKDRMGKAAGLLIALRKGAVRSEARADHADLGVVDPRQSDSDWKGCGIVVTFRGEGDAVLAELIVGREVEGRPGLRYVRIPEQRRTYMASIDADVSTRFADWVETDLLKLQAPDIERLVFDNYSIDEEAGAIRPGERIQVAKKEGAWDLPDLDAEAEELDTARLDEVGSTLGDLTIVGVRPKPEGIDKKLMYNSLEGQLIRQSLAGRGYFPANDGKLYSNEGDLLVTTKEGVLYTLRFGEIVYGSAEEVSAESEAPAKEDAPEKENGEEKKELAANRYLMVTVDFDISFFPQPEGTPYPEDEAEKRRQAIRDIRELDIAVAKYKVEKKELPKAIADALDEDSKKLALDPWGHDYVVEPIQVEGGVEGGEEVKYRVVSHGADGEPGGEHVDLDINSHELPAEEQRLELGGKVAAWKEKLETGKKRAKELSERFAPWYYVIDAASFDKLKLGRADLVAPKPADPTEETPVEAPEEEPGAEKEPVPEDTEPKEP
ncbi:MAG: DUF4340 domain-containing protein, partial [Planctomycetota bacterium]